MTFEKYPCKNRYLENNLAVLGLVRYLMNCWLDSILIRYGGSLDISGDLTNFQDESIKNKRLTAAMFQNRIFLKSFHI